MAERIVFRQVLCLAKTGSSFVRRLFARHGAQHEYDFESIASVCLGGIGSRNLDSDRRYLEERRRRLNGTLDVSTSLVFLHERSPIDISDGVTLLLARDPYTWIRSVIQYSFRVHQSGELEQEGGWRKRYGIMFTPNASRLTSSLKSMSSSSEFTRIAALDLLRTWIRYTGFIAKTYDCHAQNRVSLILTKELSSVDSYETMESLFGFKKSVAPLDLFNPVNRTAIDRSVESVILAELPNIQDIRVDEKEDLRTALSDAQNLYSEQVEDYIDV